MPLIQIQGTTIAFPDTGSSPAWSPAVIDFAVAVQNALAGVVGPSDVAPQTLVLDSFNPGSNIPIPNLTFSTTTVRGAYIRYTCYRSTSATSAGEIGLIKTWYNPNGPTNNKWEYDRDYVGNAQITFTISDQGAVSISTATLAGINHVGSISYSATALLQVE